MGAAPGAFSTAIGAILDVHIPKQPSTMKAMMKVRASLKHTWRGDVSPTSTEQETNEQEGQALHAGLPFHKS